MMKQDLAQAILQEIDALLKKEALPVSNDHLEHLGEGGNVLAHLIALKREGLICGDLVSISASGAPHRMTNIKLSYAGIRALGQ
ncbi:MAG TPA: hypothetical protein VNO70_22920 [Blastocatellia bacterium]|nr:hypothetical protein [Blastocatellia bacterium]